MPRAVYIVLSDPKSPELAEEYDRQYDDVHIPEVLQVPGFRSARRLRLSQAQPSKGEIGEFGHIALYEIESDDLPATFQALADAPTTPLTAVGRVARALFVEPTA